MKTTSMKWLAVIGAAVIASSVAHADDLYNVTINTSVLSSNVNAPYTIGFQLTKGTTTLSNSATLSGFSLNNVTTTSAGVPFFLPVSPTGTATGDMNSAIVLNDAGAPNGASVTELDQDFAATGSASSITFTLDLTKTSTGTIPDGFNIFLYDTSDQGYMSTTAPDGSGALAEISLADATGFPNSTGVVSTFATTGPEAGVTISITPVAAPEPTSWVLGAIALGSLVALRRRFAKA